MKPLLCILSLLQISAVLTEQGGLRLNWSQLRFSYSSTQQAASYSEAQEQAWQAGLAGFADMVKEVYRQQNIASQHVPAAVASASRHLFLQKTLFFADFKAEHQVSGSMVRLFPDAIIPHQHSSRKDRATAVRNTGLLINVAANFKPRVLYEIKDAAGNILFDVSHVNRQAFKSRLMGRYFSRDDRLRIRAQVGNNPYTLQAQAIPAGHLQVDASAWEKFSNDNAAILADSRIAIVLPE